MTKTVLVGVSSSVAAFKAVQLVSDLVKQGYDTEVIMSANATQFIQPLQFSSLTHHPTVVDTFAMPQDYQISHIALAKKADVFILAPATANVIAKVSHGLADDMLTTAFLAATCPKLIAPAMNTEMLNNPITQENLERCRAFGMTIIESTSGLLACGDIGNGKLAPVDTLIEALESALESEKPLFGKHVLISAGPTHEPLDPVRFLTNYSSGKMGYALAKVAQSYGADVTLVSGPTHLKDPYGVQTIRVSNAQEMKVQLEKHFETADILIMAAAVADYSPTIKHDQKMKKSHGNITVELQQNPDILKTLAVRKTHQVICGFAMETENILENAQQKFIDKHCDYIVLNNLRDPGAGFQTDTNKVTILSKQGIQSFPLLSKQDTAKTIIRTITGGSIHEFTRR